MIASMARWLALLGPGLVVMLADTDAGSVVTSAQSGAMWGYGLLPVQLLVIPVLYMVQELTVRLGLGTGKGYGELVLQHFGRGWAYLSTAVLAVSCLGALVTQLSGLAGVGQIFGVPVWATVGTACTLIFLMVLTGSYHAVERVALLLGACEIAFVFVAWQAHPQWTEVMTGMAQAPVTDRHYLYLLAANLGTSIMPWTVFYQQSAMIDKGLGAADIKAARLDTALGAVLCQVITMAVLVAAAAAFRGQGGAHLENVSDIARSFAAVLGEPQGSVVFSLGLGGGALVATIVVCLASAWAIGEVCGIHHSLEHPPARAFWFYGAFGLILLVGGVVVASGVNLIHLSLAVGVLNAMLLPFVLGIVFQLAYSELPAALRLRGWYAALVGVMFLVTAGLSVLAGVLGMIG